MLHNTAQVWVTTTRPLQISFVAQRPGQGGQGPTSAQEVREKACFGGRPGSVADQSWHEACTQQGPRVPLGAAATVIAGGKKERGPLTAAPTDRGTHRRKSGRTLSGTSLEESGGAGISQNG